MIVPSPSEAGTKAGNSIFAWIAAYGFQTVLSVVLVAFLLIQVWSAEQRSQELGVRLQEQQQQIIAQNADISKALDHIATRLDALH